MSEHPSDAAALTSPRVPVSLNGSETVALRCGGCLYDLTGLPNSICPECGRPFDDAHRIAHAKLARWHDSLPRTERAFALRAGITIVLAAVIIGLFLGPRPAVVTLLALLGHVTFTAVIGLGSSLLARRWERAAFLAIWLRHAWWLHLPWLCVPIGVGFVLLLGLLVGGLQQDAGLLVALMLLQPWIALVVMALIGFPSMATADLNTAGIHRRRLGIVIVLASLTSITASAAIGGLGGAWIVAKVMQSMIP